MTALAVLAAFPAVATPYFFVIWTWFDFWRRHAVLTFVVMLGTTGGWTAVLIVWRDAIFERGIAMPSAARALGWALLAASSVLGMVADRQLGLRVRAFIPFFLDEQIELRTTGAYGVVRHPLYAAGISFQLGAFLVIGAHAIAIAICVLTLGALWFTRQEEQRLRTRLADPAAYDRYRARVPALFPWPRG